MQLTSLGKVVTMLFNFNIVDEGINDIPVTEEQVTADIDYDVEKNSTISGLDWIVVNLDV